jgi:hypothetical protein
VGIAEGKDTATKAAQMPRVIGSERYAMKTTWNWEKFINITQFKYALTSNEIASVIASAAEKVLDWHDYKGRLVVSISGRGGRFVSYWQLSRAVEWLVQAIESCWDSATWFQLQKWIQAAWKRYRYSPEAKQQVEQALQQQQARLEERAKAEDKANLFVNIISDCQEHKSLDLAGQLFSLQRSQFEKYPDLIERVMEAGQRQRGYLQSLKEQNQQAIAPPEAVNYITCSTSAISGIISRSRRSMPILSVIVELGQEPQAPCSRSFTIGPSNSTSSTLPPSEIR